MAKRKGKGRKMNAVRKHGKTILKVVGFGIGSTVATIPVTDAVYRTLKGFSGEPSPEAFGKEIRWAYGIDPNQNNNIIPVKLVTSAVVMPALGLGIMFLFGKLAKKL